MVTQTHRLPRFAALAAFVVFLATMGSELTVTGLPLAGRLAGWDSNPIVGQPVLWLLTLPLRVLPAASVPLALKLLAAATAAAIIGLLTRTVQLLPWDRLWDGASRLACILPIATATVFCAFEYNFWQDATSTCAELVDVLLIASALWLLLEYNVRRQAAWLNAAFVVWGAGMAENWVMVAAFPLFIAGVIWLLHLSFFEWRFILRMLAFGFAGFCLYAIVPFGNWLLPHGSWTLGQLWLVQLRQTELSLVLPFKLWRARTMLMGAGLGYSIILVSLFIIPMRDDGTQNLSLIDRFQIWLFRGLRLGLLLICVWVAFDPVDIRQSLRLGPTGLLPTLTLAYFTALSAAFLLGNLLLIPHIPVRDEYRYAKRQQLWRRLAGPIAAVGLALVAVGLLFRNAPPILAFNFHPLERFGDLAVQSLPPGRGIVLSDFPDRTMIFRAALARSHRANDWLAVDTAALPDVQYRAALDKRRPAGWLTDRSRHQLNPGETAWLLADISRSNRLFYLHPSYGHFLEGFYLVPSGSVYEVKPRGNDPLAIPQLSDADIAANEKFWTDAGNTEFPTLTKPPQAISRSTRNRQLGLIPPNRAQEQLLGSWFSIPVEAWAVALQKQGRLHEAKARFELALQLNPNNLAAHVSLVANTNLLAGEKLGLADVRQLAAQLGDPDRLQLVLRRDGPFDEPTVNYMMGIVFLDHNLRVQAAEELSRATALAPDALAPKIALADALNKLQMPARSRPVIDQIHQGLQKVPTNSVLDMNVALLDSYSWLLETNFANARHVLSTLADRYPDNPTITSRVIAAYLAYNDVTNALQFVDSRLQKSPDDIAILQAKAAILMQSGRCLDAVPVLDHVLSLTNEPEARVDRALARIAAEDFDTAQSELNELQKNGNDSPALNFGFALVAEHSADTNAFRHYLQLCASNTPPGSALWYQAVGRLRRLDSPPAPH